jgi:signal peptidase I
MMPTIFNGERITVRPIEPSDIEPGDIILYRYPGSVIAHRVVRIEKRDSGAPRFILRGDALGAPDEVVEVDQVLGKVVFVERSGRSIDLYSRRVKIIRMLRLCASHIKRWARIYFDTRLPRRFAPRNDRVTQK